MESKVSIELDFDKGNLPVIQVLHKTSDDVRDGIIGNFIEHLNHTSISRWLKMEYKFKRSDGSQVWHLVPISGSLSELEAEANLMLATINSLRSDPQVPREVKE